MPSAAAGAPPDALILAQELAAEPDALHWACVCSWVPGTGHCRDRNCAAACIFRPQREAEAARVRRWRRLRRMFSERQLR